MSAAAEHRREGSLEALDRGAMSGHITYTSQAGVVIHVAGHYVGGRLVPTSVQTADDHAPRRAPEGWDLRRTRWSSSGWHVSRPRRRKAAP